MPKGVWGHKCGINNNEKKITKNKLLKKQKNGDVIRICKSK